MFTSTECRTNAAQKLAEAEHIDHDRKRFIAAAEGWITLPRQLRRPELSIADATAAAEIR
jgi:hypothetical protein